MPFFKLIYQSKKQFFLVLSDSLSVLRSISNCKCDNPLLVDLLSLYFKLICDNKDIVFASVSGHVGIRENKLYKIQPKVDDPIPPHGRCHCEETVLCRLHIGHTLFLKLILFIER